MTQKNFLSPFLAVLAVLALTLPLIIYWHAVNRGFPRWDEGEYFLQSMDVYRSFVVDGFASGLRALYEIRNFRATIHPALALPAFFLLGPRVLLVQAVVQISLYATLVSIIYLLCRIFLPMFDAILVTSIAVNLPSMKETTQTFNSELPFTVLFSASLFALSCSDLFLKKWPTLVSAIFLGLAFGTRPAEGVLRIAILLPFLVHAALKHEKWGKLELKFTGVLLVILGVAVAWGIADGFTSPLQFVVHPDGKAFLIAIGGITAAWTVYFLRMRRKTHSFFPVYILLSSSIAIFWFAAYLKDLARWILYCSYSTQSEMSRFLSPDIIGVRIYPDLYGNYIGPVGLAFFAVCIAGGWRTISGKTKTSPLRVVLFACFLVFAVHTGLGAISHQIVLRYYCLEITALWAVGAMILLSSPGMQSAKRAVATTVLAFLMLAQLNVYGVMRMPAWISGSAALGFYGKSKPDPQEDQAIPLFQALLPALQEKPDLLGCIYMIPHPLSQRVSPLESAAAIAPYTEPWTLRLMAREKNLKFDPQWVYQDFENWDQWRSHEGQGFDNCLIGPMEWANQGFLGTLNRDKSIRKEKFVFHYGDAQSTLLLLQWRKSS